MKKDALQKKLSAFTPEQLHVVANLVLKVLWYCADDYAHIGLMPLAKAESEWLRYLGDPKHERDPSAR